jgi:predicted small secreted protein
MFECFGDVRRVDMKSRIATVWLIGTCLALAACNTVRGAAADVGSAANCTEDAIHGGRC